MIPSMMDDWNIQREIEYALTQKWNAGKALEIEEQELSRIFPKEAFQKAKEVSKGKYKSK